MAPPRLKLVAFPVAYQILDMLEVPLYDYQTYTFYKNMGGVMNYPRNLFVLKIIDYP